MMIHYIIDLQPVHLYSTYVEVTVESAQNALNIGDLVEQQRWVEFDGVTVVILRLPYTATACNAT
jgi:hypothetical protein